MCNVFFASNLKNLLDGYLKFQLVVVEKAKINDCHGGQSNEIRTRNIRTPSGNGGASVRHAFSQLLSMTFLVEPSVLFKAQ